MRLTHYLFCYIVFSLFNQVVEFAEYGNLHESSELRSVERLCRFTIQAATALEHLEAKKVIHCFVKSFNCLVVAKDQVRLLNTSRCVFSRVTL